MSESNKAILKRANAAILKGDYEGFLSFCTEDTTWTFVGERTLEGKDAVRRWMAEAYEEPPQFEVQRMIAEGDFVAALGNIALNDERAKPIVHAYCDVWHFIDGKMAALEAFVIRK